MQADSLAMAHMPAAMATEVTCFAARYPCQQGADMAGDLSGGERFWSSISAGASLSRQVPATRWDIDACYAPELTNRKM